MNNALFQFTFINSAVLRETISPIENCYIEIVAILVRQ